MLKSNYITLIAISIIAFLVSSCKPGDYTYRVATGNTPEDTARGSVIQATAEAAKEMLGYESYLHDLDVLDRTQQADLRKQAMQSNIQNEITTTLITAQAKQQFIVELGRAEADSIRAIGQAAATSVTALSFAVSAILFTAALYMFIIMAIRMWLEWRRVSIAQNAWQLLGPGGLPSNFILLRDGNRLFIQDVLTGERGDVRKPAQVNAVRAQLLLASGIHESKGHGIISRVWDAIFGKRRKSQVLAPMQTSKTIEVN